MYFVLRESPERECPVKDFLSSLAGLKFSHYSPQFLKVSDVLVILRESLKKNYLCVERVEFSPESDLRVRLRDYLVSV